MKLLIDIDDKDKKICEQYINGKLGDELGDYINITELADAIADGTPYEPKADLISREDLKEKAYTAVILEPDEKGIDYVKDKRYVVDLEDIDNATTVKAYTDEELKKKYDEGRNDGYATCYDRYVRKNDEPFC